MPLAIFGDPCIERIIISGSEDALGFTVQVDLCLRLQVSGGEIQVRVRGAGPAGFTRVPPLPPRVATRRRQQGDYNEIMISRRNHVGSSTLMNHDLKCILRKL